MKRPGAISSFHGTIDKAAWASLEQSEEAQGHCPTGYVWYVSREYCEAAYNAGSVSRLGRDTKREKHRPLESK